MMSKQFVACECRGSDGNYCFGLFPEDLNKLKSSSKDTYSGAPAMTMRNGQEFGKLG
jgi:hypothetical protein